MNIDNIKSDNVRVAVRLTIAIVTIIGLWAIIFAGIYVANLIISPIHFGD